jgi:hypothetical protein
MAFLGVVPPGALLAMIPTHSGAKILYELLASPLSAALAQALKRWEGVDVFDVGISLTPFGWTDLFPPFRGGTLPPGLAGFTMASKHRSYAVGRVFLCVLS